MQLVRMHGVGRQLFDRDCNDTLGSEYVQMCDDCSTDDDAVWPYALSGSATHACHRHDGCTASAAGWFDIISGCAGLISMSRLTRFSLGDVGFLGKIHQLVLLKAQACAANRTAANIKDFYKIILCPAQPRAELAARLARACCGTVATAQAAQSNISILLGLAATVSQKQCAYNLLSLLLHFLAI
jgi:hypothetical protein